MKRWTIDAPSSSQYEEHPEGEWVRFEDVEALLARFAGPRCECCGSLCIDAAKDEQGFCPDCSSIGGPS
jgi:hypothetical protein